MAVSTLIIAMGSVAVSSFITEELDKGHKSNPIINTIKLIEMSAMGAIVIELSISTVKQIKNIIGG